MSRTQNWPLIVLMRLGPFILATLRALIKRWYLSIPLILLPQMFVARKVASLEEAKAELSHRLAIVLHPEIKIVIQSQIDALGYTALAFLVIRLWDGYKRRREGARPGVSVKTSKRLRRHLEDVAVAAEQQRQNVAQSNLVRDFGYLNNACDCPDIHDVVPAPWSFAFSRNGDPHAIVVPQWYLEQQENSSLARLKCALHEGGAVHV